MSDRPLTRWFLRGFLGFLVLSAVIAIATVLRGKFDETSGRILGTSATISVGSILAMACAAYRERVRSWRLGELGIGLVVLATTGAVALIWWHEHAHEHDWFPRTVMVLIISAVSLAQAQLLWLPRLQQSQRWVQIAAGATIAALALLLNFLVLAQRDDIGDVLGRVLAVLAILDALLTLMVPLVVRLEAARAAAHDRLVLQRRADGSYVDASGNGYAVQRLDPGPAR